MSLLKQIILLSLSTISIITSLYYLYKDYIATKKWIKVIGTIIEFKKDSSNFDVSASSPTYYPIIKYSTIDGDEITKESDIGTSFRTYEKGQEIDLYYNPNDKTDFVIKSKEAIIVPLLLLFAGIGILAYYLYMPISK